MSAVDLPMNRFWISLTQVVHFSLKSSTERRSEELYGVRIPGTGGGDLTLASAPNAVPVGDGIQADEDLHEGGISLDKAMHTIRQEDWRVVLPMFAKSDFKVSADESILKVFFCTFDSNES